MTVNGEFVPLDQELTLHAFLLSRGFNPERVAVEQNRAIIPRALFAQQTLAADDNLEIVQFVGGG